MKKIALTLLLLSLALFAEKIPVKTNNVEKITENRPAKTKKMKKITVKTIKNEFIIAQENEGNLNFINKKYHKKNVVFYLFGRDCPHCQRMVPRIKKLMKNKKLQIIGMHAYKNIGDDALRAYAKKVGYTFDILSFETDAKMLRFLKDLGVWEGSVPFTALVDTEGNVYEVDIAMIDEEL